MPPLEHLTCSGKQGTGGCTKPPIWRRGERDNSWWPAEQEQQGTRASVSPSGSFQLCCRMSSVRLSLGPCPLRRPLDGTGAGRVPPLGSCLGLQGCSGIEQPISWSQLSWVFVSTAPRENLKSLLVCFQSIPGAGKDSHWSYLDEVSGSGNLCHSNRFIPCSSPFL